jgi:hypothetical protein
MQVIVGQGDPNGTVVIVYQVTVDQGKSVASAKVYYGPDPNDPNRWVGPIAAVNNPGEGVNAIPVNTRSVLAGEWYLFVEATDSSNAVGFARATGKLKVTAAADVTFQDPNGDVFLPFNGAAKITFTPTQDLLNYTLQYDVDTQQNGNERNILTGSAAKDQPQILSWQPYGIEARPYYVLVKYVDALGQTRVKYDTIGRIILDAPPSVQVTEPSKDLQLWAGTAVDVLTVCYDKEKDCQVKIFFDANRDPNDGSEPNDPNRSVTVVVPKGAQAANSYQLSTSRIPPGRYYVGLIAADGINAPVSAYAPGQVSVFSTTLNVQFLQPTGDVSIYAGDSFDIAWQVSAPSNGGTMDVLYVQLDANGAPNPQAQEKPIISNAPIAPDVTTFNTKVLDVVEGASYRLRIRVKPTVGNSFAVDGPKVTILSRPLVTMTKPPQSLTIGTTDTLLIEWQAEHLVGPLSSVSAQLFLDQDTVPSNGNEIELQPVVIVPVDPNTGTYRLSYVLNLKQNAIPVGTYYFYVVVHDGANVLATYGSASVSNGTVGSLPLVSLTIKSRLTGMFWMGDVGRPTLPGITFVGFDFYDNAGSLVRPLGDFDGDGYDDFLIVAQFAKPLRSAALGDAYLIYGDGTRYAESLRVANVSNDPNLPALNLNSVGTTVRGALLIGPQEDPTYSQPPYPQSSGIQEAVLLPDLTGDGVGELGFGIPYIFNSQSLFTATPSEPLWPTEIVLPGQLRRGGVILVTSQNELNQKSPLPLETVLYLDQIGQHYLPGTLVEPNVEILKDLSGPNYPWDPNHTEWWWLYKRLDYPDGLSNGWGHPAGLDPLLNDMAGPRPIPWNFPEANLNKNQYTIDFAPARDLPWHPFNNPLLVEHDNDQVLRQSDFPNDHCRFTGCVTGEQSSNYGSRIVGDAQGDYYGSAIAWWRGALVTSSAKAPAPSYLSNRPGAGLVYISDIQHRVSGVSFPPWQRPTKPSNLVVFNAGPYGHPTLGTTGLIVGATADARLGPLASLGRPTKGYLLDPNSVLGDFNGDGLEDLALGSPGMNSGDGAAYVFYVRLPEPYVFDLAQIDQPIDSANRRAGLQINGRPGRQEGFGEVTPAGLDFNHDGFGDAVFGNPRASNNTGEVVLVYGGPQVAAQGRGFSIDDIAYGPGLSAATADPNQALGVVFQGINPGDFAGAAVAAIGDFDGDGVDDLAIACPNASPMFDSDGDGVADTPGVDRNGDGRADVLDSSGAPLPLTGAGVVYIIYGQRNTIQGKKPLTGYISLAKVGSNELPGVVLVGKGPGDALGGGWTNDGNTDRVPSRGVALAGDVDGDGKTDILVSSVRASPQGHIHAGEVYLIFGLGGQQP